MNAKTKKYSIRYLQSESRWVICPAQHGETEPMSFKQARIETLKHNTKPQPEPVQFESMEISSGLGIGGYGSDDYNIWTEHDRVSHPERSGCRRGGTRYDEACRKCGRVTEICNDCELCENCHE